MKTVSSRLFVKETPEIIPAPLATPRMLLAGEELMIPLNVSLTNQYINPLNNSIPYQVNDVLDA